MNTDNTSPKGNMRMNRIRIVSRIVKIPLFAMFGFLALTAIVQIIQFFPCWFQTLADLSTGVPIYISLRLVVACIIKDPGIAIISAIWFWKLGRLFHFYERGMIFARETVRCIKFLGVLCVVQWTLCLIRHFLVGNDQFNGQWLFSLPIGNMNLGLFLIGIVIVSVAWIMDEGRKIQEEQELTV